VRRDPYRTKLALRLAQTPLGGLFALPAAMWSRLRAARGLSQGSVGPRVWHQSYLPQRRCM